MQREYIYINGKPVEYDNSSVRLDTLLRGTYIYTSVYTASHRPLHLKSRLNEAADSCLTLLGRRIEPDTALTAEHIERLLRYGHHSLSGNTVDIFMFETGDTVIKHRQSTIYTGYSLSSIRPEAVVVNYEIPFEHHHTSMSLQSSRYMERYAASKGAGLALRVNRSGMLVSACDCPVFVEMDGRFTTPKIEAGGRKGTERNLMMEACRMAGIEVRECDIPVESIATLGEIGVFTPAGVLSVLDCSGHYYHNIFALQLETTFNELTLMGLKDL